MSKLPIFTNGELQTLVRGPVLQDKRTEHVKFQEYAMELIKKVSGPEGMYLFLHLELKSYPCKSNHF